MTLEPTMLAAEQRLQRMASDMPAPDVDASWAALAAKLEPPLAQVIPLRHRSLGRPIALAAAATLLVAGGAFAAVGHGRGDAEHVAPVVSIEAPAFGGPHAHPPFQGPPATPNLHTHAPTGDPTGAIEPPAKTGGSTGTEGSGDGRAAPSKHQDDPNDLDQGTGNDGQHNDHGGGNNGTEGSKPRGQSRGTDGDHGGGAGRDHGGGAGSAHGNGL